MRVTTGGNAKVKMGALKLTSNVQQQHGILRSVTKTNLDNQFSMEIRFRMSGQHNDQGGESIGWFITAEDGTVDNVGEFFGASNKFQGIAVTVSTDHPDAEGNAAMDAQKIVSDTIYAFKYKHFHCVR